MSVVYLPIKPRPSVVILAACPFCKGHELEAHSIQIGHDGEPPVDQWAVACVDCLAFGPAGATKTQAEALWNECASILPGAA